MSAFLEVAAPIAIAALAATWIGIVLNRRLDNTSRGRRRGR